MKEITLEELLEAGAHFGHQVIRSNPKARDFVFEAREGIQIIDLAKTKEGLDAAAEKALELGKKGASLLVVATKKQAKQIVEDAVRKAREDLSASKKTNKEHLFYITQRWIGGTLTNFSEVSKNLKKLADLKKSLGSEEEKSKYTKKEIGLWEKEIKRLESFYKGIVGMEEIPNALFIVDTHFENLAVKESNQTNVETIGIVDTNADPLVIDYPIPANDDAVGSITLIVEHILNSFAEGLKAQKVEQEPEEGKKEVAGKAQDKPKKEAKPKTQKVEKKEKKSKPKKTSK